MASILRTVSWVWLTLIGVAILLISLESAQLAYRGPFSIGGVPLDQLAAGREVVLTALRGARGTAASYAFGFGLLYLLVVLVPYRRGETWSWWALLSASLAIALVALARMPLLGVPMGAGGTGAALVQSVLILLGLLLDVGRLGPNKPSGQR